MNTTYIRNPFRDPTMRGEFDAMVVAFRDKHKNLFRPDGSPHYGNGWAANFWAGYRNEQRGFYKFRTRSDRQMIAYASYRAGQACAAIAKAEGGAA